ncbi:MAG: 2TM domain-containing protein [Polaribacter sp.]
MKRDNFNEEHSYIRAKKRVKILKGFYWHLIVYIVINLFISSFKIIRNLQEGETFDEAFFDFGTFSIWMFWGIGIVFHALKVFGFNFIFGNRWEEKKIKEYMN